MDNVIELLKTLSIGFGCIWLTLFMVWPINDDQSKAPVWVICRFTKMIYTKFFKGGTNE